MIKETNVKKRRTDLTRQLFDMKMDTKIGFWNVEQHWNGIHKKPGKEDALKQHGDGQC
jgi:hypothetical protein